jgi:hypothetical protein
MKSLSILCLLSLTSCASFDSFFKPKEQLAVEDGCAIVVPKKLKVCETPESISVERGLKSVTWNRGAFIELISQKIELGLKKSGIQLADAHNYRLAVFSEALMTERILWNVQVENEDSIFGFSFSESPSSWGEAKPLWVKSKAGDDSSKFTGSLLLQWDSNPKGMPKELFQELFPEYKVIMSQGLVWKLGIPLQEWKGFQEKVASDPWISKGIKAMRVIPYSAALGREREITNWTWQGGVLR